MRQPDYERDGIRLYCGDCLEIMPHVGRVDAVVTDPPYNYGKNYGTHNDSMNDHDFLEMA